MMLPTPYKGYQQLLLDILIYGKIKSAPHQSLDELKENFFKEFNNNRPYPKLEDKRYELSQQVSSNYKIIYDKELELQDDEFVISFDNLEEEEVDFSDLSQLVDTDINENIRNLFTYENKVKDSDRENILNKYNLKTGELIDKGKAEEVFNTVAEDKSLVLDNEQINQLEGNSSDDIIVDEQVDLTKNLDNDIDDEEDFIDIEDSSEDYSEEDDEEDYSEEDDEEDYSDDEDYSDEEDYSDDEEDYSDDEEDYSDDEEDYSDDEEDYSDDDSYSEDDDYLEDDNEDYSNEGKKSNDIVENENNDVEDEDYSEEDEDYYEEDEDYSEEEDEDYSEEDEDYSEEDEDYSEEDEDYSEEEGEDYSEDEEEDYSDDEDEDYSEEESESYVEEKSSSNVNVDKSVSTIKKNENNSINANLDVDDIDLGFTIPDINIIDNNDNKPKENKVEEQKVVQEVKREEEPKDLRQFIRKHPRCELSFALKYFSKKEIDKNIKMGKIIRKGNILRI